MQPNESAQLDFQQFQTCRRVNKAHYAAAAEQLKIVETMKLHTHANERYSGQEQMLAPHPSSATTLSHKHRSRNQHNQHIQPPKTKFMFFTCSSLPQGIPHKSHSTILLLR